MKKVQIVTDSMTDIPKGLMEKYNIIVVPLTIYFGDAEFKDGVDLTNEDFYRKLSNAVELPKTSQVPPKTFNDIFAQILEAGKEIICVNGSGRASGTYQSAIIAREDLATDKVDIFDSMALSFGGGLLVYEAAKMAEDGAERRDIIQRLTELKPEIDHIFTVDTLEFLRRGGRLNPMKAVIGGLLNIKPILTVREGLVEPLDKVRGSKKVIGKMVDLAKERGGDFSNKTIAIAHADTIEACIQLKEKVEKELKPKEIVMTEVGCTIGTHGGPGTLGMFYYR
ncbi:DegV family protein [Alkaliphilus peptidifermentans]|uniref:EDD domain protein, DegV family n=1 Tax=Alkaliphilus peptidifermentans DSM 18978 TaxID=1120976 RepID=A0A1G5K0X4_9FIRM|nr:DegV family protein [Alkaliphilus peptidifermentans]SCY94285.1 EDD domain protein, DegV family [Alkaliphilus peptidifermentans DSM 18978]